MRIFVLLLTIFSLATLKAEIIESNEIQTVQQYANQPGAFVFFNVTSTLYVGSNTLSNVLWREYFSQRVEKLIKDPEASQKLINRVKNQIVQKVPKKTVEKITPELIAKLQDKKIVVLGLTKKLMSTPYAENFGWITQNHLASLGIHLDRTLSYLPFSIPKGEQKGYRFAYGILFTEKQPEGPAVIAFLKDIKQKPSIVIAADNDISSLKSLEDSLKQVGIPFKGIRYGRADSLKTNFEPTLGTIEFLAMMNEGKMLSDEEALKIKQSYPETNYEEQLDSYIQKNFQQPSI